MMKICDTCISIGESDSLQSYRFHVEGPVPKRPNEIIQCPECGAWWKTKDIPGIMRWKYIVPFKFDKVVGHFVEDKNEVGRWEYQKKYFFEYKYYRPIECSQRKCGEQAFHKIKIKGKYKYKCDRHAGVCIIF